MYFTNESNAKLSSKHPCLGSHCTIQQAKTHVGSHDLCVQVEPIIATVCVIYLRIYGRLCCTLGKYLMHGLHSSLKCMYIYTTR